MPEPDQPSPQVSGDTSGDQDAAEKSYRRALKIDPNLPVGWRPGR